MRKVKRKKEEKETPKVELPSLSRKEHLVLEMLMSAGRELFGLEMVEASNGTLKRGTIYVTLQRMQEKGLVDSKPEPRTAPEIGIPRRLYSATRYGAHVHRAYQAAYRALQSGPVAIGG